MYGANINGMTTTVDIRAMTALKQDGTAFIPASLVIVLKGMYKADRARTGRVTFQIQYGTRVLNGLQSAAPMSGWCRVVAHASPCSIVHISTAMLCI